MIINAVDCAVLFVHGLEDLLVSLVVFLVKIKYVDQVGDVRASLIGFTSLFRPQAKKFSKM